jgi:hypothetical protein
MRLLTAAALVAFAPATSFAFAPMGDVGQQVRGVSSAPVVEVGGCDWQSKRCGKRNRGARNWVGVYQRNNADVDIRSGWRSRNDVSIDQRNRADVDIDSGRNSRNSVWIQQSNEANVNIR